MNSPRVRLWRELTTEDFAGLDAETTLALLPLAAIEQHGAHLPLSTDADIADGVIARTVERLTGDFELLILPRLDIGLSPEHADFPGTLTLEPETMIAVLREIGAGVADAGLRKLVLFNTHGGQSRILDIAAQALRRSRKMLVVSVNLYRLWRAGELFAEEEIRHGIHAGALETSIMLHLRPDLVRREAIADNPSLSAGMASDYRRLAPFGEVGFGWQTQDLNPTGAVGDARLASAEAGKKLVEQAALAASELLGEVARLPLSTLKDRPKTR
ncbi:MAG: creatininase family protein [Alphaproteobacteria bacterium]